MSTGIAVGTSTEVHYTEEVRYWEGPLSEVPLYLCFSTNLLNIPISLCKIMVCIYVV